MEVFKNRLTKIGEDAAITSMSGVKDIAVGPPESYGGSPETLNPEEMFVAAINNCIMTTFFYFVRKSDVEILSYYSDAEGKVEKQTDGFRFTYVEIRAKVTLSQQSFADKVRELGNLAERYCLVSRSVACPIDYQLQVEVKGR